MKEIKKTNPDRDSEASIRQDFYNMPFHGIRGDGVDSRTDENDT